MKATVYLLAWMFWAVIVGLVAMAFGIDFQSPSYGRGSCALFMAFITIRLIKIYTEDETK